MLQLMNAKKNETPKQQPEDRTLRLRIEQLESRIAPRCITIMKDIASPK